jgi:uncharacterized Fe-S center protein
MRRRAFLQSSALLAGSAILPGVSAAEQNSLLSAKALTHRVTDAKAPEVFFVPEVNSQALIRVYESLRQSLNGKVGIKMTFETPGGPHLDPQLVKALAQHTKATLIDNNCFSPRDTTEKHLQVAKENGFDESIASIDILDSEGFVDLPVSKGYHLKFTRTGSHFLNYDTLISIVRFKAHFLDFYGGTLKNLSICMGTGTEGKCFIHSAGEVMEHFSSRDDKTTCESMSDAVKGAMEAKKGRWAFINVIDSFEPSDGCDNARNLGNVGILASLDPVAVDQAAIDITFGAAPNDTVRHAWEERHSTMLTAISEANGIGHTHYRLTQIK